MKTGSKMVVTQELCVSFLRLDLCLAHLGSPSV